MRIRVTYAGQIVPYREIPRLDDRRSIRAETIILYISTSYYYRRCIDNSSGGGQIRSDRRWYDLAYIVYNNL